MEVALQKQKVGDIQTYFFKIVGGHLSWDIKYDPSPLHILIILLTVGSNEIHLVSALPMICSYSISTNEQKF